jgi:hypothetical protein
MLPEELGMVVHTCNPTYLGGRDMKIIVQSKSWQKLERLYFKNKLMLHAYNLRYFRGGSRRTEDKAGRHRQKA